MFTRLKRSRATINVINYTCFYAAKTCEIAAVQWTLLWNLFITKLYNIIWKRIRLVLLHIQPVSIAILGFCRGFLFLYVLSVTSFYTNHLSFDAVKFLKVTVFSLWQIIAVLILFLQIIFYLQFTNFFFYQTCLYCLRSVSMQYNSDRSIINHDRQKVHQKQREATTHIYVK